MRFLTRMRLFCPRYSKGRHRNAAQISATQTGTRSHYSQNLPQQTMEMEFPILDFFLSLIFIRFWLKLLICFSEQLPVVDEQLRKKMIFL